MKKSIILIFVFGAFVPLSSQLSMEQKLSGLFYGSLFGDALGGPIEFQGQDWVQKTPHPIKIWEKGEVLNTASIKLAEERLMLRTYRHLLPTAESYGVWTSNALPGRHHG